MNQAANTVNETTKSAVATEAEAHAAAKGSEEATPLHQIASATPTTPISKNTTAETESPSAMAVNSEQPTQAARNASTAVGSLPQTPPSRTQTASTYQNNSTNITAAAQQVAKDNNAQSNSTVLGEK